MAKRGRKTIGNIIFLCIVMVFLATFVSAVPGTWKGFVTINDQNAPKGIVVDLFLNNFHKTSVETGQIETAEDYYYLVTIEGNNVKSRTDANLTLIKINIIKEYINKSNILR